MKNKNKILIIILLIFVVICIVAGFIIFDITKIIEKPEKFESLMDMKFDLSEKDNKIYFTTYYTNQSVVRTEIIYNVENDIIISVDFEKHYQNKLQARSYFDLDKENIKNARIKDNVFYGKLEDKERIGKSKQFVLEDLKTLLNVIKDMKPIIK